MSKYAAERAYNLIYLLYIYILKVNVSLVRDYVRRRGRTEPPGDAPRGIGSRDVRRTFSGGCAAPEDDF